MTNFSPANLSVGCFKQAIFAFFVWLAGAFFFSQLLAGT